MPLAIATASASSVEGDHHLHRPEDLLLRQPVVRRHAGKQRRRDVVPAGRRVADDLAPRRDLQIAGRGPEKALDDLLLPRRDQRPDVEIGHRRPDPQRRDSARPCAPRPRRGSPRSTRMREDGRTGLAGVLDAGIDEERQRRVEIGVGEHQLRRLAAELQRHRHDVPRRRGLDEPADRDRAGEGDVVDARMRRQRRARLLASPGTTLSAPAGQPRLLGDAPRRRAP